MANLQLTNDLITDALFRSGEPTDGTSDFQSRVLPYINRGYQIIWNGGSELDPQVNETWWWLLATTPGTITLEPKSDAGNAVVTNNSQTIEFTTGPTGSRAGWFFRTDDNPDIFRISSHVAGATTATLDSVYTGDTATAAGYKIFKAQYNLATDVLHLISPMRVYRDNRREIGGSELSSLERDFPLSNIQGGVPRRFAHTGEQEVRFSHYGLATAGDRIRVDYDYMIKPALLTTGGTDAPVIPTQYRYILGDYVAFRLLMDKDDSKAEAVGLEARQGIRAMAIENRRRLALFDRQVGHIAPRPRDLPRNRFLLRTEAGLIVG